jgi:hypothetical protein
VKKCDEFEVTTKPGQVPPEFIDDLKKLRTALQSAADAAHAGGQPVKLTIRTIKKGTKKGTARIPMKAEGEQNAMEHFGPLVRKAGEEALDRLAEEIAPDHLRALVAAPDLTAQRSALRRRMFGRIRRVERDDEDRELTTMTLPDPDPVAVRRMMAPGVLDALLRAAPAPSIRDVAPGVAKPQPPPNPYHGCTSKAVDGDHLLNERKNRGDSADWQLVSISSILDLDVPEELPRDRRKWTTAQKDQVAQFEGTPVQVEGWLVDMKKEGSEACNCSSCNDRDYHLWIADSPEKIKDKTEAMVAEITPRISRDNAGQIAESVSRSKTPVQHQIRVSGWLMLDQIHISKPPADNDATVTRRTPWEIHPIIKFEIQDPDTGVWSTVFEPEP